VSRLCFELGGVDYALPLCAVSGVAECGALRAIPGAPPPVLGVTEWRGHLLTVLDLPRLLGHTRPPGRALLVRLAPPLAALAFHLPATVRIAAAAVEPAPTLLDAPTLLRELER
jgi:chemotaxis signal transduction protein